MLPVALAALLTAGIAARLRIPRLIERRVARRRPTGPDGIILGAEPIRLEAPSAPALLVVHGGGDTPQVVRALARHLHDHGFAVSAPLLSGHGRTLEAFRHVSADGWLNDVRSTYVQLRAEHDWVGIVGLSLGAALAVRLTAEKPDIPALVLLSPYIAMPAALRRLAGTTALWGPLLPYFSSRGARSIHNEAAAREGLGYGYFTPNALRALWDTVRAAERSLPDVKAPVLMVQSRQDNRISVPAAEEIFRRLGASEKRLCWVEGAGHVITVDYGYGRVFDLTAAWMLEHAARRG